MPRPPLPAEIEAFLERPNPAVIATLRPDGSPHCVATWYEWANDRVLVNMDESRARLGNMRRDPRVSLTVLSAESWYTHVSLFGRVVEIRPDLDLADIDRLATRYVDRPHRDRERRRVSAEIEVTRWFAWDF